MYHTNAIHAQDIIFILFMIHVCLIPTMSLRVLMSGESCFQHLVPSCKKSYVNSFYVSFGLITLGGSAIGGGCTALLPSFIPRK